MVFQLLIWCLLGIALLVVSINDFLFFRIENEVVIFLFGLYAVSCISGVSGSNFIFGFSIATVTFAITCILNRLNMMGGGDVKLLFPLLLFMESDVYQFAIGVSIAGILLSIIYVLFVKKVFFFRRRIVTWLCIFQKEKNAFGFLRIILPSLCKISRKIVSLNKCPTNALRQEIPYGIALSGGVFYVIAENLLSRC